MFKSRWMVPVATAAVLGGLWLGSVNAQEGGERRRNREDRPNRQQQNDNQRGENQRGERGNRGGGEDFRQRMAERTKASLGVSDEEWTVIQPRIEKINELRAQSRMGGFGAMMMGGPRGGGERGGPAGGNARGPQQPQSEVAKATVALRQALQDEKSTAEQVKTRLDALRTARAKANLELTKAQDELRELLTARQEAQLVVTGVLD